MKGTNTISLNQATMQEALQMWVDSKFVKSPGVVTDVDQDSNAFVITIESPVDTPDEAK